MVQALSVHEVSASHSPTKSHVQLSVTWVLLLITLGKSPSRLCSSNQDEVLHVRDVVGKMLLQVRCMLGLGEVSALIAVRLCH